MKRGKEAKLVSGLLTRTFFPKDKVRGEGPWADFVISCATTPVCSANASARHESVVFFRAAHVKEERQLFSFSPSGHPFWRDSALKYSLRIAIGACRVPSSMC